MLSANHDKVDGHLANCNGEIKKGVCFSIVESLLQRDRGFQIYRRGICRDILNLYYLYNFAFSDWLIIFLDPDDRMIEWSSNQ